MPLPLPDPPAATIIERLAALEAYVSRNDARISALEANVTRVEEEQPDPAEFGRLAWFMKHGRRRPW
jgi:hypothetical protein